MSWFFWRFALSPPETATSSCSRLGLRSIRRFHATFLQLQNRVDLYFNTCLFLRWDRRAPLNYLARSRLSLQQACFIVVSSRFKFHTLYCCPPLHSHYLPPTSKLYRYLYVATHAASPNIPGLLVFFRQKGSALAFATDSPSNSRSSKFSYFYPHSTLYAYTYKYDAFSDIAK